MSALGQKQTCAVQEPHVRFTPESRTFQFGARYLNSVPYLLAI